MNNNTRTLGIAEQFKQKKLESANVLSTAAALQKSAADEYFKRNQVLKNLLEAFPKENRVTLDEMIKCLHQEIETRNTAARLFEEAATFLEDISRS